MRRRHRVLLALLALLAVAALAIGACVPTYVFDGADAGGADATMGPGDGGPPADHAAAPDAGGDSVTGGDAPQMDAPFLLPDANWGDGAPIVAASAGTKQQSTGYGYQTHLVYAENDGRFWLFYVDDTSGLIETRTSPNLVDWTSQAAIPLGAGTLADGFSFSVGYANVGGTDVIHIVANTTPQTSGNGTLDVRATIAGGALMASSPTPLADTRSTCGPDGPAAVVRADGRVYEVTAWTTHPATGCDTNIYRSTAVDTGGASWSGTFDYDGYFVSVPNSDYAHDLVDLPQTGVVLALWPDEDNVAYNLFDSIDWALSPSFDGGGPDATGVFPASNGSAELFYGAGGVASWNDWADCRLTDQDVHLIRHVYEGPDAAASTTVGAFQHVIYGGTVWQGGAAPPPVTSPSNSGVVLVGDSDPAHGMLLASLGTDNSLNLAKWTSAGGWTALPAIPGAAPRFSLAGTHCGSVRPALFWTEGTGASVIMMMDVSHLLGP